jgi:hypothetical protein
MSPRNLLTWVLMLLSSIAGPLSFAADQSPIGARPDAGCLADPKTVDRLDIDQPGIYENYRIDGRWGKGNRVKITADNVTLRHCEIFHCAGNAIGVFANHVTIENCKIHHCLQGSFQEQHDAHGITGRWGQVVIHNCDISRVSGDAVQFDPDRRSAGKVVVENCTFWTAPLEADLAGFHRGERPGENGIDTKVAKGERCELIVRNTYFHGWNQPASIGNMAALNLKENVVVTVENCLFRDNEIALRIRGPGDRGGAQVRISRCAIYDSAVGVRLEDRAENLKINRLGFGPNLGRKYHILEKGPGAGYENTGEFAAPPFETALADGL